MCINPNYSLDRALRFMRNFVFILLKWKLPNHPKIIIKKKIGKKSLHYTVYNSTMLVLLTPS